MFSNSFKTAWWEIVNYKLFSLLNITETDLTMAVSFLLSIFVLYEYSYDSLPGNRAWLLLGLNNQLANGIVNTKRLTPKLLTVLQKDFHEVAALAMINLFENTLTCRDNLVDRLKISSVAAEQAALDMYDFQFLCDNKDNALMGHLQPFLLSHYREQY